MSHPELNRLLKQYYEGATSSEDEIRIRELLGEVNSSAYLIEKEMFKAFDKGDNIPEPASDFESRIMERIDEEDKIIRMSGSRRKLYSVIAAAASILLLLTSYFVVIQNGRTADTFTDPQLAYLEVIETFKTISEGMNSGRTEMSDLAMIDKASESIGLIGRARTEVTDQLKPISYINMSVKIIEETSLFGDKTK